MSNPEIILKEDVHTQVETSFFEKGTVIINLYMKTLSLRDDTKEQMTLFALKLLALNSAVLSFWETEYLLFAFSALIFDL